MCRYESLLDGTLTLADLATMQDWLSIEAENTRRYQAALMRKK